MFTKILKRHILNNLPIERNEFSTRDKYVNKYYHYIHEISMNI